MAENHFPSWENFPSNSMAFGNQATRSNSIFTLDQILPRGNYFIDRNDRDSNRYSRNNGNNDALGLNFFQRHVENGARNVHGQRSSFRSSAAGIGAVGPRNGRHGRGMGSREIMNELDYKAIMLRLIEGGNLSETRMIIEVIKDHLHEIMVDRAGNCFVQSLLEFCHENFIDHLLLSLIRKEEFFVLVCLDNLGHQAVVKLMDRLRWPYQQSTIALAISDHAFTLAKSFNGGHVVLKHCFLNFPRQTNELILLRMAQSCLELSRDQAGCCILQVCIEYAIGEVQEAFVSPLIQDAENLSRHVYGNYVIQFVIQLDGATIGTRIIKELRNKFVGLSLDKYGSNVVERCLSCCESGANQIIFEIIENDETRVRVCTNEYGNYVVQRAISVAKGEAYSLLIRAIKNHRLDLIFHPYGKNVIGAIKRIRRTPNH